MRVSRKRALGLEVKGEYDDGQLLYEVEFRAGGVEYEYEVRASDGRIVKAERDGENMPFFPPEARAPQEPRRAAGRPPGISEPRRPRRRL